MNIVYTIGYEGTDIEKFIKTLKNMDVERLADVRALPLSRKKGFSKTALSERLNAEGIEYVQFRCLGDPKAGREAAKKGKYSLFREIYLAHLDTDSAKLSFKNLLKDVAEKRTCMLCFEREPTYCHRSIIAERLSAIGFEIFNLFADDPERYVHNAEKISSYYTGKSSSAA